MRRGLDWYKREQRAILDAIRAAKMTDRQAAIYNIVLDLIYDGGGETPDDPRHIASYLSNVGQAAARAAIQQLVHMGKLTRLDGMLTSDVWTPATAGFAGRPHLPSDLKAKVMERDHATCAYCGTVSGPMEIDHILPWSRGGDHSPENLTVACRPCNRSKRDRTPKEMGWQRG